MRLELTRVGLLAELANHYTTRGASFGSVHGLLRYNINAGVHARAGEADMSLRDVTIAQMGNGVSECEWRHAPEARRGFGDFEKVS